MPDPVGNIETQLMRLSAVSDHSKAVVDALEGRLNPVLHFAQPASPTNVPAEAVGSSLAVRLESLVTQIENDMARLDNILGGIDL
jgi:hypothetical protein